MISARPHNNLIEAVPKLGIPDILESYLVYDVFLDHDENSDVDFFKKMIQYYKKTDSDKEEDSDEDIDEVSNDDDYDDDDDIGELYEDDGIDEEGQDEDA